MDIKSTAQFRPFLSFQIDINGDGSIQLGELQLALKTVGLDLPGYEVRLPHHQSTTKKLIAKDDAFEVRELIERFRKTSTAQELSFWEFSQLYAELREKKDFGHKFKKSISWLDASAPGKVRPRQWSK